MSLAFQITSEDVSFALDIPLDDPRAERCFKTLTREDFQRIENDALYGNDLDKQTSYARVAIREILSEKGFYTTGADYEKGTLVSEKVFMNPENIKKDKK
jgi:hypothetical protein